jgi:hypothetical protein
MVSMNITVDGWAWLPTEDMRQEQADWLRRQLTVADVSRRDSYAIRFYSEKEGWLGIPRGYMRGNSTSEHVVKDRTCSDDGFWPPHAPAPPGASWSSFQDDDERTLTLVDSVSGTKPDEFYTSDQRLGVRAIFKHLAGSDWNQGIASFGSPQGGAKVCLGVIRLLRARTLIITLKGHGVDLWRTVIGRYMPDAVVAVIEGQLSEPPEADVSGAHIAISTVEETHDALERGAVQPTDFGFVISDQIHLLDPVAWSAVIPRLYAARRLGTTVPSETFSGGPRRAFSYHLGGWIFAGQSNLLTPRVRRVWSGWKLGMYSRVNPQFISRNSMLQGMCSNTVYNKHVVEQVLLALKAERKIVVFSENLKHLRTLRRDIESQWSGASVRVDYAIDGMSPVDIGSAVKSNVILSLFRYANAMPDIPDVDTVVLATPVKDPTRAIRVCLTRDSGKKDPIVVDMRCDAFPVCKEYGEERDRLYKTTYGEEAK